MSNAPARADASPAIPPTAVPDDSRHISPYSTREKVGRMLWAIAQASLFRLSFHTWNGFRAWLLRRFGATIAPGVRLRRTVTVECPWNLSIGESSSVGDGAVLYCLGRVAIGRRVTISQRAHICAGSHDYRRADMPLLRPPITIGDDVWIAADAFVGPGLTVGEGAILGARACAFKSLSPWTIYLGNPCQPVRPRPPIEGR